MFDKNLINELIDDEDDKLIGEVESSEEEITLKSLYTKEPIVPITFTNMGILQVPQLIDLPFQFSNEVNSRAVNIFESNKSLLTDALDVSELNHNNIKIMIMQMCDYIYQNSYSNFCSAIDNSEAAERGYLRYIPVKEFVLSEMDLYKHYLHDIVSDFYYSKECFNINDVDDPDRDNKIGATAELIDHICLQIVNLFISIFSVGTDKAINDIVLQVHEIPNIDTLYSALKHDDKFFRTVDNKCFPALAAAYLKNMLRNDIENIIKDIIFEDIKSAISLSYKTYYDAYSSRAKELFEIERNEKKKLCRNFVNKNKNNI